MFGSRPTAPTEPSGRGRGGAAVRTLMASVFCMVGFCRASGRQKRFLLPPALKPNKAGSSLHHHRRALPGPGGGGGKAVNLNPHPPALFSAKEGEGKKIGGPRNGGSRLSAECLAEIGRAHSIWLSRFWTLEEVQLSRTPLSRCVLPCVWCASVAS